MEIRQWGTVVVLSYIFLAKEPGRARRGRVGRARQCGAGPGERGGEGRCEA